MSEVVFGRAGVAAPMPARDNSYAPSQAKLIRRAFLCFAFAAFMAWPAVHAFTPWFLGGTLPSWRAFFGLAVMIFLCTMGVTELVSLARGLPLLTIGRDGIEIETLFQTKWATWKALGLFSFVSKRGSSLACDLVGGEFSANLQRRRRLTIPNEFETPLTEILADLHAHQPRLVAAAPPSPETGPVEQRYGVANFAAPWLSIAILAALALIFYAEQIYAIEPPDAGMQPSVGSLIALGGLNRALVLGQGEWYRLFTGPLLHANLTHIVSNGFALVIAGSLLEKQVGRLWFLAFFITGALGGAVLSLIANPANMTGVGASGAISGLFGAAYLSSFRLPAENRARWRIQLRSVLILLPALIPHAPGASGENVDYAAHLGGALSGAALAWWLYRAWPEDEALPGARGMAAAISLLGLALLGFGAVEVSAHYSAYKSLAGLIPSPQVPRQVKDGKARAGELVARYPADPRGHYYRALVMLDAHEEASAERELRTALEQMEALRYVFDDKMEVPVRTVLAAVLFDERKTKDAKEIAEPLCAARDQLSAQAQKFLADAHLCEG
jgi:rhomboid protease GluP